MSQTHCHILLVEEDPVTVTLIQTLLTQSPQSRLAENIEVTLTTATTLKAAIALCQEQSFDILLLDLFLPETQGISTLVELRKTCSNKAIIVLTHSDDETLVIQAFQHGADGYLRLKNLDENLLFYEVLSVLERQNYRTNLESQQRLANQQQEYQNLELLVSSTTSITARLFGSDTIKVCFPDLFQELKQTYGKILDLALEQRAFRVEYNLSEQLRLLADKLGFLKASPRDVIELHSTTLKEKNRDVSLAKAQAYVVEGRLMILELMGYLTSFYRKYYIGLNQLNISSRLPPDNDS
jgi:DNA-binding NarL/FixJ family response regulator